MKRLLVLGVGLIGMALILGVVLRTRSADPDPILGDSPPWPRVVVEAELTGGGLVPYRLRVPKDHDVRLLIRGSPDAPEGRLEIRGYDGRVEPVDIGAGQSRELSIRTERPGDDFGIVVGDRIVGRLEVTGGHLEEGHQ